MQIIMGIHLLPPPSTTTETVRDREKFQDRACLTPDNLIKKRRGKLECLIFEMLLMLI